MSIRKIRYRSDGSIYSDDEEINKDVTETLNLNCEAVSLPATRKKVLQEEQRRIMRRCKGKSQEVFIRELERTYESLVRERDLTPYCGIIISWLENKLENIIVFRGDFIGVSGSGETYTPKYGLIPSRNASVRKADTLSLLS